MRALPFVWVAAAVLLSVGTFTHETTAAPAPTPAPASRASTAAISADDAVIAAAATPTASTTSTATGTTTETPAPATTTATSAATNEAFTASASSAAGGAVPTLAPIATAAPDSSTFQLVKKTICSEKVVSKLTKIYTKNRALFDECTADADFQIFPNSGKRPDTEQVRAMATSRSCFAIFSGVVRAGFPACDVGGMPMKSAAETLLKIKVDIDEGRDSVSGQRFNEMMKWRRDVNLALEAGVPYDGDSELFKEYKVNLWKARASTTVRVSSDFTLEYQLQDGTYTRGQLTFSALDDDDSGSGVAGRVRPAGSGSSGSLAGRATLTASSGAAGGVHVSAFAAVVPSLAVLLLGAPLA
ncbi:hypothetical protein Gpo141_00004279 [Globisporangium polare]